MKPIYFLLIPLILVASCTIEKRIYRKGVHAKWHKSYRSDKNSSSSIKKERTPAVRSQALNTNLSEKKIKDRPQKQLEATKSHDFQESEQSSQTVKPQSNPSLTRQSIKSKDKKFLLIDDLKLAPAPRDRDPEGEQIEKVEGFGVAGFIVALLGIVSTFMISILIGMMLAIIAIVFGGIGIRRYLKHPAKYGGNGLAVASLTLGIILLLTCIIFIVILL